MHVKEWINIPTSCVLIERRTCKLRLWILSIHCSGIYLKFRLQKVTFGLILRGH